MLQMIPLSIWTFACWQACFDFGKKRIRDKKIYIYSDTCMLFYNKKQLKIFSQVAWNGNITLCLLSNIENILGVTVFSNHEF